MENKYFRIKSSDNYNNAILELISDVDLYTINQVLNHQYISTDDSLPEMIYFKFRYIEDHTKLHPQLLNKVLPLSAITKSRIKDFVILPLEKISHLPSDLEVWVDYTKSKLRYKMMYNIKLHDDTIIYGCYPNGNTFFVSSEENENLPRFEYLDDKVKEIQLRPEIETDILKNSEYAIKRNFELFKSILIRD